MHLRKVAKGRKRFAGVIPLESIVHNNPSEKLKINNTTKNALGEFIRRHPSSIVNIAEQAKEKGTFNELAKQGNNKRYYQNALDRRRAEAATANRIKAAEQTGRDPYFGQRDVPGRLKMNPDIVPQRLEKADLRNRGAPSNLVNQLDQGRYRIPTGPGNQAQVTNKTDIINRAINRVKGNTPEIQNAMRNEYARANAQAATSNLRNDYAIANAQAAASNRPRPPGFFQKIKNFASRGWNSVVGKIRGVYSRFGRGRRGMKRRVKRLHFK